MFGLSFTLVAGVLAIIYFYVKYLYSYWQRRGIPYLKPSFPFGNFAKTFMQKLTLGEQLAELYRSTSEPFIGIFMLQEPLLLIRDPKLIQRILIMDFQYFTDRKFYLNDKNEPLTAQINALRGQDWRDRRAQLAPAFKPSKMKKIFSGVLNCGNQLQQHLSQVANENQAIEMHEVIACFASNVTASIAFGIDINCFVDSNYPFQNAERQMFEINLKNALRFIGWFLDPTLLKWSGLRFMDRSIEEYFLKLVAETLKMREQRNIVREDLFQFLIELRNGDTSTPSDDFDDEWTTLTEKTEQKTLSIEQVAAETFGFYFNAVKATLLVTSYCLYEIAKHPDVQRKIHAEIDSVMAQHNGQLTYESVNELKYLDCCIDETLRKYMAVHLSRVCVKDYKIPGTNVTFEKGTLIVIPTPALHHDEKFYPDPKNFDPTRFNSGNKADKINMPYFSFGEGPRACLGQRMGRMFVKVGICSILRQYYVDLDDRHIGKELKLAPNMLPVGGIHLKLMELK